MVSASTLLDLLGSERVMPIIRSGSADDATAVGLALMAAGYRLFEISLTTPGALDVIARLTGAEAAADVEVGAGTVLTARDAEAARDAGASFIVTPAVTESIAASSAMGLPVLAGALTPSEIVAARAAGATAVKLFPAELGGPDYFSALRAPFPDVPLIPVGGVTLDTGREYLERGALALGVGSPLTGRASDPIDLEAIARRAVAFKQMGASAT